MDQVTEYLVKLKQRRAEGKQNSIPFFDSFPRLSKYVPGISKGTMYGVTANSGVGKSKLARYMFIKSAFDYVEAHPESGIDLRVIYFALEESAIEFKLEVISMRLAEKHNIYLPMDYLKSEMRESLSDDVLEKIKEDSAWRERFFEKVEVIDNQENPTGLWRHCQERAKEMGVFEDVIVDVTKFTPEGEKYVVQEARGKTFIPHNPELYVIVVVDHLNLLKPEKEADFGEGGTRYRRKLSQHETIAKWVGDYARKHLCKEWNWSVINVMQQAADSESQQYARSGSIIGDKTKPTLQNLGNNKEIQRDHHVIMGLWDPSRYGVTKSGPWDIRKLKDNYRELSILKNRRNRGNIYLDLFFEGASGTFKELPPPKDKIEQELTYKKINQFQKKDFY